MKIKKIATLSAICLFAFAVTLTISSPKKELLYKTESILSSKKIELQNKDVVDYGIFAIISNPSLKVAGNDIIGSGDGCFFSSFIYNSYSISSPKMSELSKAALGIEPKSIKISSSIFVPAKIWIQADGDFGSISGTINLKTNKFKAKLKMSQAFETGDEFKGKKGILLSKFKQTEEGFVYESDI